MQIHVIITNTDEGIYSDLFLSRDDAISYFVGTLEDLIQIDRQRNPEYWKDTSTSRYIEKHVEIIFNKNYHSGYQNTMWDDFEFEMIYEVKEL